MSRLSTSGVILELLTSEVGLYSSEISSHDQIGPFYTASWPFSSRLVGLKEVVESYASATHDVQFLTSPLIAPDHQQRNP